MMYPRTRKPTAAPKRRKQSRVGKTGTVRVVGVDMTELRKQAYLRSNGFCEMKLNAQCGGYTPWKSGELAHIRTKRNHGDSISNVKWSCAGCHRISHAYGPSNRKPVPPKMEKNA